jgi:hypothetical protein
MDESTSNDENIEIMDFTSNDENIKIMDFTSNDENIEIMDESLFTSNDENIEIMDESLFTSDDENIKIMDESPFTSNDENSNDENINDENIEMYEYNDDDNENKKLKFISNPNVTEDDDDDNDENINDENKNNKLRLKFISNPNVTEDDEVFTLETIEVNENKLTLEVSSDETGDQMGVEFDKIKMFERTEPSLCHTTNEMTKEEKYKMYKSWFNENGEWKDKFTDDALRDQQLIGEAYVDLRNQKHCKESINDVNHKDYVINEKAVNDYISIKNANGLWENLNGVSIKWKNGIWKEEESEGYDLFEIYNL